MYVAGAWRFVQCNWGARHLVNAKEVPRPGQAKAKNDSLRYELGGGGGGALKLGPPTLSVIMVREIINGRSESHGRFT